MKRIPYKAKKKLAGGGFSWGDGQGQGITGAATGLLGTAGDMASANNGDKPSMFGSIASNAGKYAGMGATIGGPWGAAIGGAVGIGMGIFQGNKDQEDFAIAEENRIATDIAVTRNNSEAVQANFDNTGTGVQSFEEGGAISYPFQKNGQDLEFNPTIQLAAGGYMKPISDTTTEVVGNNPNAVDGVELDNAFVNHGETVEKVGLEDGGEMPQERVYTDEFGVDGKKAGKKNPSFADLHKKLQKSKSEEPEFEAFNAFIDGKSDKLFAAQESLKGADNEPVMRAEYGGKIGYEEGGKNNPIYVTSATPGKEYARGNLEGTDSWYKDAMIKNWGDNNLQGYAANSSTLTGTDPTELSAAMLQEGWNPDRFANIGEYTQKSKKTGERLQGLIPEEGLSSYYAIGLDTVGDHLKEIGAKTGYKAGDYSVFERDGEQTSISGMRNEKGQRVVSMSTNNYQKMMDTAAGLYKYRSEIAGNTAKDLGLDLDPRTRKFFNYVGYNTQHNSPYIKDPKTGKTKKEDATLRKLMLEYKKDPEKFMSFTKVKDGNFYEEGDALYNNYKHAAKFLERVDKLSNAYKDKDETTTPETEKAQKWELEMERRERNLKNGKNKEYLDSNYFDLGNGRTMLKSEYMAKYAPKEGEYQGIGPVQSKENGGYTDMNTVSAEYMKANLTKRKKGGYEGGGITPGPINERSMSTMKNVITKRKKKSYLDGGLHPAGATPGPLKAARYSQGQPAGSEGDASIPGYAKSQRPSQMAVGADPMMNNIPQSMMGANPELLNSIQGSFEQSLANPIDREQEALNAPLATGEATPDMSTQLMLGTLATAPLTAGASLLKKAVGTFKHSGQGTTLENVPGQGQTLEHDIMTGIKQGSKGANTNTYGNLGYKNGGKMKYVDGGPSTKRLNLEDASSIGTGISKGFTNPNLMAQRAGINNIPELSTFNPSNPIASMATKLASTPSTSSSAKEGFDFQGLSDTIGTYGTNLAGMATRLPETPKARMLDLTTLERVDNKEQLDVINREARSLDKSIAQNTAQSGNAAASRGNVLAKKLAAQNASYDRTDKTNVAIQNQEASIQAQQKATNLASGTREDMNELSRRLKEKEIRRDSLTNAADKYMAGRSEDKMRDLDLQKMQLTKEMYAGTTGIDERALAKIKEENPELYKTLTGKKYGGLMKKKKKAMVA